MKVSGEYRFGHPRAEVWDALLDPRMLAATLPGARRLTPAGPDEYEITVDVGVGSVRGTYDGSFAITDKVPVETCTVRATASGRPGTVTTVAQMRLIDGDGGAVLAYEADAGVTGPLAGVGQRLMGAAARRTTEQFLRALDERIGAPPAEEAAAQAALAERPPPRPSVDARVIGASALAGAAVALLGVVVGRWTARR
ncbi:MAG TPA: carbon monoxide dehydrogenase subunit G [Solirubrobacteraceae bacterium]|nr:carbon monoxide dehydrogenase subunit G [Solirubrobacteraceae bacterium]